MSEKIEFKTEYQHSRLRTEMYLGSRSLHTQEVLIYDKDLKPILKEISWVPALYTAFRELLDNACDEVIGHAHGDKIDVEFNEKTLEFSVADNGRGIPIDYDEDHATYTATLALSKARAGRNFSERGEVAGTNGLGAATVNFCSETFSMEIHRGGKRFYQTFREGHPIVDDLITDEPKISKCALDKTGTKISCRLSKQVFKERQLPTEFIKSRVVEIAICNPLKKFTFNGERIKVRPKPEQNLFQDKFISIEIKEAKFNSKFFIVPNWHSEGEFIHSIVNNIPAFNGGSHIDAFRRTFYKGLLSALEKESKRRKLNPNNSDIQKSILVYNITKMSAPNFDSQSKTRLINEAEGLIVRKFFENEAIYKDIIKKNREWIDEIYEHCAERTQKKDIEDIAKLGKKILKNKVPKLTDAIGKDRSKCILFLAEGDSAVGGMSDVRDPNIHGGLPLRGKVLNVYETEVKKVLDNEVLKDIMNSLGLVIHQKADRTALRYGKVYIATDMDPDGSNIAALLINFFYKFWPELFDPKQTPIFYIFQTPFLIGVKGKERKYWYGHNYQEYNSVKDKEWKITRAKGLGTLTKEDWEYSMKQPELIPILDDGKMADTLNLIFASDKADARKDWIGL